MKTRVSHPTLVAFAIVLKSVVQIDSAVSDGCPAVGFAPAITTPVGFSPVSVAVGDFNRDGNLDLVVGEIGSAGVLVLLGNGDGTFQTGDTYNAGQFPFNATAADFNGDGKLDLAVDGDFVVSVFLGNGDGTFQRALRQAAGKSPDSIGVGDFNGDGKVDLAVGNLGSFDFTNDTYIGSSLSVLLGNGDGTFQTAVNYDAEPGPFSVTVSDFDGDGKQDLAVANHSSHSVSVMLGNGDATFLSAVNYEVGDKPVFVKAGEFNGDGKPDLAVANDPGNVSVLLGNGNGTFQDAVNYDTGGSPASLAVADFNGDGKLDLIVDTQLSAGVSTLQGNGDGTFQTAVNYITGGGPIALDLGDFNGDGQLDLAVVNNSGSVAVLLNTCVPLPALSGVRTDSAVTLTWPFPSRGFLLESTTNLLLTNWQAAIEVPVSNGGSFQVSVTPTNVPQRYFRLRKP
jgi:VCBS repeat protein